MRRRISNLLIDLSARRAFDVIDRLAYWRRLALTARSNRAFRADLRRAVRPGGVVMLTTHGNAYRIRLTAQERARYDAGEMVVRTLGVEGRKLFAAFHPPAFVRARLLSGPSEIEHRPGDGTQDIWVTRRPT